MNCEALMTTPEPEAAFEQPWQAEAFATAVHLSRQGAFAWPDWVANFSKEIAEAPQRPGEDIPTAYYRQWLATLEKLLNHVCDLSSTEITARQEEWRRAYLATPHGQPVDLARARVAPTVDDRGHHDHHDHHDHGHQHHHHDHGHHGMLRTLPRPIVVSPAIAGRS